MAMSLIILTIPPQELIRLKIQYVLEKDTMDTRREGEKDMTPMKNIA